MRKLYAHRATKTRLHGALTLLIISCFVITQCHREKETAPNADDAMAYTQFVDPYIGSGGHGHVFVGANVPFGAVQLGPVNFARGWDWCSGYHYSDSIVVGFSHTHLSGTGIGDLGDILVMPAMGEVKYTKGTPESPESGYASKYTHGNEKVKPGYYSVNLSRYNIQVELTATERVGFHRYTFPGKDGYVVIDLGEGIGWDSPVETHVEQVNDSTLAGYRYSSGWAADQRIFFTAIFSTPIDHVILAKDDTVVNGKTVTGKRTKAVVKLNTEKPVLVKIGISPVSAQNAALNIRQEIPHWNFDAIVENADRLWNHALGAIQVQTKTKAQQRIFYTALYHTMIAPSIFNDVNGDYRGSDKQVYHDTSFTNLTTFSLWDTYRATHQLHTIINADRVGDMVNSLLKIHEQQGKLPIWHLWGNETNTMPGNSSFPVIADAILKGIANVDEKKALDAMVAATLVKERGLPFVNQLGYIPADSIVESVALGLEYSIDDWCAAQVAKKLGQEKEYLYFLKRAGNYKQYFDPKTRFMRGKLANGAWRTPFSPVMAKHMKDDFCEGNAWQYTWLVPHDVEGLMQLLGGEKAFVEKLDSLFVVNESMGKEASADITGLIGQYAIGNEPSHHIAYLYGYTGSPWKTAKTVRNVLDQFYHDAPDGIPGNEDVGQMSAWYIFSSLGFYPVNPANGMYVFGSPAVDRARIRVSENTYFDIEVENNAPENIYIQRMVLNGIPYTKTYLTHSEIAKGGRLEIQMGPSPSKEWGTNKDDHARSTQP